MAEPPFWDRFWDFATIIANGWSFRIGLFLMIEPYLEGVAPEAWKRFRDFLSRWWPQWRARLFRAVGLIAILWACFQAWDTQFLGRLKAESNVAASSPIQLQKTITALKAKINATVWDALTSDEITALQIKLSKIPPEPVVIGCETANCKDLAESFYAAFKNAGWTNITLSFHGGFDISGYTGLMIDPAEERTDEISSAIESTTTLKIIPSPDKRQPTDPAGIFISIGAKPF